LQQSLGHTQTPNGWIDQEAHHGQDARAITLQTREPSIQAPIVALFEQVRLVQAQPPHRIALTETNERPQLSSEELLPEGLRVCFSVETAAHLPVPVVTLKLKVLAVTRSVTAVEQIDQPLSMFGARDLCPNPAVQLRYQGCSALKTRCGRRSKLCNEPLDPRCGAEKRLFAKARGE
jgi:hypothetical protein